MVEKQDADKDLSRRDADPRAEEGVSVERASEPAQKVESFDCTHCGAQYKLMKFEADATTQDLQITCRSCGGPLHARQGVFALKYFMVDRPKV